MYASPLTNLLLDSYQYVVYLLESYSSIILNTNETKYLTLSSGIRENLRDQVVFLK